MDGPYRDAEILETCGVCDDAAVIACVRCRRPACNAHRWTGDRCGSCEATINAAGEAVLVFHEPVAPTLGAIVFGYVGACALVATVVAPVSLVGLVLTAVGVGGASGSIALGRWRLRRRIARARALAALPSGGTPGRS